MFPIFNTQNSILVERKNPKADLVETVIKFEGWLTHAHRHDDIEKRAVDFNYTRTQLID